MTEIKDFGVLKTSVDATDLFAGQTAAGGAGSSFRVAYSNLVPVEATYTRTLFVGKHGNDSNDGTNPGSPFLTIGAAITAASALTPAANSRVAVFIVDGAEYVESITQPDYVNIIGPAAALRGTLTVGDAATTHISRIVGSTNNQELVLKESGDERSVVHADVIDGTGAAANAAPGSGSLVGVFNAKNETANGILVVHAAQYYVGQNGDGVGSRDTGNGHIHVYADDIYNAGDGAIAVAGNITNSTLIVYAGHIKDINGASGTAIRIGSSGDVYVITNQIVCSTAYQINGSGNLRLVCPDVQGARIGNVTCELADDRLVVQLPTAATGLPPGAFWVDTTDGNTVKVVT